MTGTLWPAVVARGGRRLLCYFSMQVIGGVDSRCGGLEYAFILWPAVEARRGVVAALGDVDLEVTGEMLVLRFLGVHPRQLLISSGC
jgi:hypothetical protein